MAPLAKVLVVDDDFYTRQLIAETLEDEGYLVRVADSAAQALVVVEAEHYDIILLDLRMPGTDGAELFHTLYERALATMPIILMTADQRAMQELIDEGVKFILFKPFDLETLLSCVAEALQAPNEMQGVPPITTEDVHICS